MHRILILISLFIIYHPTDSIAQEIKINKNSVFLELAGSGGIASLNYERIFYDKKYLDFSSRIGFSFAPLDRNNGTAIVVPIMLNLLVGQTAHKLELGIGQGLSITTKGSVFALFTPAISYRYQAEQSRLFYRLSYTPLLSYLIDYQVQHWAGISIGYRF